MFGNTSDRRPLGVAILGSTGSIGTQTLEVIQRHPERFRVVALAAKSNERLLAEQAAQYKVETVALEVGQDTHPSWLIGEAGLLQAATHPDTDILVVATSGHAAILPTIRAIEAGKTICLANKEVLVCAGELITFLAAKHHIEIRPVDSEHSAIWQALGDTKRTDVEKLILTASGGPFRKWNESQLSRATATDALAHPVWHMGAKVTIDSATLMNKGLEIIEAHWLFNMPYSRIDVVIHPQSVVHSLVEFRDGSQIAQLGSPDMRLPIQYALTWPDHLKSLAAPLDLAKVGLLEFETPDYAHFPALKLAYQVGNAGGTLPTVLSAADDVAVQAFLQGRIGFNEIVAIVSATLDAHQTTSAMELEAILDADKWARTYAIQRIESR